MFLFANATHRNYWDGAARRDHRLSEEDLEVVQ